MSEVVKRVKALTSGDADQRAACDRIGARGLTDAEHAVADAPLAK